MRPDSLPPADEPISGAGPFRLTEVPSGVTARLYRRDLSEGECCLLAAMGLGEGCRLTVRSHGDPCIVEVRSTRIGLARTVADRLFVLTELDGRR
jgi:Fe2+ transport system protein FeoA